jgi:acyl-CoA synthetase (AMP-forming)/AMP-acid ligase II
MSDQTPLSRARAASPVAPRPPHDTLVGAFEAVAAARAPFVTFHAASGPLRRDAREALARAHRWAALVSARGVRRRDRVLLLLPASHAFVEALLGTMLAGAVPVPLATPMTFGSMDRYLANLVAIARDADARLTLTYPRVAAAIVEAGGEVASSLGDVAMEADLDGLGPLPSRPVSIGARDPAFIQYTSGTTGRPKGAVISHGALVANAFAIADALALDDEDVGVSWLPLYHDMGLIGVLLTSICHPYPVHLLSPEAFVMNPRRWPALVASVSGTLSAAPNFAYDLTASRAGELEGLALSSWRVALNGAEPVHAATARRFAERFAPAGLRPDAMMPVYGLAEHTLAVAFPRLDERMQTLRVDGDALESEAIARSPRGGGEREAVSVGRPVAGTEIAIVSEGSLVTAERCVGEIRVRGASRMDGYFRNDAATAEVIKDGWLHTGDLGFLDGGRLFVTGRAKDLIIRGGKNLYPYDIERVAASVDGVRGVAAFGRENERSGTCDLVVVAETVHGEGPTREAIAAGIRGELLAVLGLKPDALLLCGVGGVPRTSSGKVRRRECARIFAERA